MYYFDVRNYYGINHEILLLKNTTPSDIKEKYISPALAGCKLLINTANDILDYAQLQKKDKLELV